MAAGIERITPANYYLTVTASETNFTLGKTKALVLSADSTLSLKQPDGTVRTGIVGVKGWNPYCCIAVTAASGSPTITAVFEG